MDVGRHSPSLFVAAAVAKYSSVLAMFLAGWCLCLVDDAAATAKMNEISDDKILC